jgi:hypothetical protein
MTGMPRIASAMVLYDHVLSVCWADGTIQSVDLVPALAAYGVYAPLRSGALFPAFHVVKNGSALAWSNDIEMSADMVKRLATGQFDVKAA